MKLVWEDIEDSYYVDVFLSRKEIETITEGEMMMSEMEVDGKKVYVGVTLDYFNNFDDEE